MYAPLQSLRDELIIVMTDSYFLSFFVQYTASWESPIFTVELSTIFNSKETSTDLQAYVGLHSARLQICIENRENRHAKKRFFFFM